MLPHAAVAHDHQNALGHQSPAKGELTRVLTNTSVIR